MALRHVVTEGDPVLRKHCREVTEVTERIRTLLGDMLETMREANGCGIAGPQVGVMRRLFVAEPAPGESAESHSTTGFPLLLKSAFLITSSILVSFSPNNSFRILKF